MSITVGEYVRQLAPEQSRLRQVPFWPPDAFAIAAALLYRSGAYTAVVEKWPPEKKERKEWCDDIGHIGSKWRLRAPFGDAAPREVRRWWRTVTSAWTQPLERLGEKHDAVMALLQIVAAADEACAWVGFVNAGDEWHDAFEYDALTWFGMKDGRTLCRTVDASRAVVLPKAHTPQTGITIRSLTHHLALYLPGEVTARWWMQHSNLVTREWCFNLLLLPWPQVVLPRNFRAAAVDAVEMANGFGFFSCDVRRDPQFDVPAVVEAVDAAREHLRRTHGDDGCDIDGVVFPELALTSGEPLTIANATNAFVVGGVGQELPDGHSRNYAAIAIPGAAAVREQSKHHRWRLNASQIEQYGLGSRLDPTVAWWENSRLEARELNFFAFNDWLTFCVFICEDLARLDPVSDLVRSVGPNLVIALLLDGPQLKSRWPARYATVLAEDPGSSVLTLTSLGMALASVPEGKEPSRVIALWKDARLPGPREISLDPGAVGVVLSLRREYVEEFSADGRTDEGSTSHLRLDRVHQIKLRPTLPRYRPPRLLRRRVGPPRPEGESRA